MPDHPPPNWDSLKTLVADALELPADRRAEFLSHGCSGDPAVLEEAKSLVAAYEQADGVIDRRTDAWLGLGGPDLLSLGGQRIGRYVLDRLLAEGAMAAVYLARQANPQRVVALKLLRCGLPLVDSVTRFKRESQALGRLQHPNIARIYEAGVHKVDERGSESSRPRDEGGPASASCPPPSALASLPYIAMEYVDGPPINVYARDRHLTREQRVRLMIKVATAVHAAHQQAIIHRDLKPANVLVDSSGEPKVLDFGIADVAGADEDVQHTWQTTAGVLLGTPGYMSPEQAAGRIGEVDVRSDVWSLGVLLHELLTDRLPIDVRNTTSIAEVLRRIETAEPQPIGRIDRTLRGDLETIVMTALAREKERRYPSAQALADDLRRVLEYEPITARAPSTWYRAKKFIRRHRIGIGVSTAFVLLVTAAAVVSSLALVRAQRERSRAEAINRFLLEMLASPDPSVGSKDVTVLGALRSAESRISTNFGRDPLTEAQVRSTLGWTYFNLAQYERANEQLARAVELRAAAGRGDDPAAIDDESRLATILRWQYRPQEALQIAQRAYDRAAATLGREHPSTVALLDPLAGAAHDMGDLESAERAYLDAVETNRNVMGPTNEQTLTAMNNLAVVYIDRGKYAAAESILRELLALRTRTLRAGSPSLITTRFNLAISISEQGRVADAEAELRRLYSDAEASLGPDHDSTLTVKSNHAEMLQRMGRLDEALELQKQAMEARLRANGGISHDQSIKEVANYSAMLNQAERWDEARRFAQQALDAALSLHDARHTSVLICKGNLAGALDGLTRHAEAQSLYREAIEHCHKRLGPEHPRTLILRNNLADSLTRAGQAAEALAILEPVLQTVLQKQMSALDPHVRLNLGRALLALNRLSESETHLLESHRQAESQQNGRVSSRAARALAELYDAMGRQDEVERWRKLG
jgi:serine/threonine protein kinase/tetratricopeptide (TPR) repeat protein